MNLDKSNAFERSQGSELSDLLAKNKVLRQTYILLSINLLFSALCSYIGMLMNVRIPGLLYIVGVFGLSFLVQKNRNSGSGIIWLFAFTGFLGLAISQLLNAYLALGLATVVVKALVGSAVIFGGLSCYALFTRRDFSFLGAFLFVGLLIGILAVAGAMIFGMTGMQVALSALFLFIFSGYVLYDTSNIIQGYETNYITATMTLFIDIFQIFIHLLQLLAAFSGRD